MALFIDLLWMLAQQEGNVLSRDQIMSNLRGFESAGVDRSIDMRISRLRKALDACSAQPIQIKTVRNKGYLLNALD